MITRRNFLGATVAVAAVTIIAPIAREASKSRIPTLWGDGLRDDSPALQAAVDGRPYFRASDRKIVSGSDHLSFSGYKYAVSRTLILRRPVIIDEIKMFGIGDSRAPFIQVTSDCGQSYIGMITIDAGSRSNGCGVYGGDVLPSEWRDA